MTKICEICGAEYEASRRNQKYCRECGRNPDGAVKHYQIAVKRNKLHAGECDKPREWVCKQCGKKILSVYKRDFCSTACRQEYISNDVRCTVCKRKLIEVGIYRTHYGRAFCSAECKEHYAEILAEQKQLLEGEEPQQEPGTETLRCLVCHKLFQRPISKELYVCSETCKTVYTRRRQTLKAQAAQSIQEGPMSKKQNAGIVSLCAVCRTPYGDCRWMSSGRVAYPVGAKVEGGNVLSCPDYR